MIYCLVYSFTNVFTYFNDYLMCRSVGASVGGLKVGGVGIMILITAVAIAIKVTSTSTLCLECGGVF